MTTQPEALRLADELRAAPERSRTSFEAAAELRRLHAENQRLVAEVANRNRRALDGDLAVIAMENTHAYYDGLKAQRDELLEALKLARSIIGHPDDAHSQMIDAVIKAVEEGK
jgi:hypothetical protein